MIVFNITRWLSIVLADITYISLDMVCSVTFSSFPDFSKDHFRENVRRMRQIQKKSREKEAESVQPVKALWKSEKYSTVPSRIKHDIDV